MELSNYGMFQTRSGLFVNRTARELLFEVSRTYKKQKHHVCSQSFTYSAYIKKADNSINKFPELFKGIKGPPPWRWFSFCQEGWNSYGQVKLQRISERLKISLSLPRFGWFYKRNGTTWSDGRVGPKKWSLFRNTSIPRSQWQLAVGVTVRLGTSKDGRAVIGENYLKLNSTLS